MTTIRSIRQPVATLSGGQRQSVAVARAVMWNSKVVILDEPTAALGVAQTEQVLALVKRLAEQGIAVVLISHNLHDIFEVADRITVLRLGRNVGLYERARRRSRRSCGAITAGQPTKVAGITGGPGRGDDGRRAPEVAPRPSASRDESFATRELRENIKGGNLGSWPVIIGLIGIVVVFGLTAHELLHLRSTSTT